MPDLADRISRAAVTALDLAPFDERFAALSRQVLTGGASRFTKIIDERQAISYVIPVGVAGERIDYGALVLQPESAGLVWRDASGVDQHATVSVTAGTPATYSTVHLGGESWVRFSVGLASRLTFLIPPVRSQALLPTLVSHFQAVPGPAPATVLREAPVAIEESLPTTVIPTRDLPTAQAAPVAAIPVRAIQPVSPAPVEETGPIPRLPEPSAVDLDATQPFTPPDVDAEPTRTVPVPWPGGDPAQEATQEIPVQREQPVAPWGAAAPFELFREPAPIPERTQVLPDLTDYPPAPTQRPAWAPAPPPEAQLAPVADQTPAGSATLRGFVIGLLLTVVLGSIVLAFLLLG